MHDAFLALGPPDVGTGDVERGSSGEVENLLTVSICFPVTSATAAFEMASENARAACFTRENKKH